MLTYNNATNAWEDLYGILNKQANLGFKEASRAGDVVGELINTTIIIEDPTRGIVLSPERGMDMRYALGELMFYLSGSNKLSDIAQYSKFWNKISDNGETVNSAYGHKIMEHYDFNQWEYIKKLLIIDPNSRQAVIHIKEPSNFISKDVACTLSLQFLIRENKLFMNTVMRSNDIWLGFPFDVFCFTSLQVLLAMELGVGLGDYTHFVGSLHLYERNVRKGHGDGEDTSKS